MEIFTSIVNNIGFADVVTRFYRASMNWSGKMADICFVVIYLFAIYGCCNLSYRLANFVYDQYEKRSTKAQIRKEIARIERLMHNGR